MGLELEMLLALPVSSTAGGPFCCYFLAPKVYVPELQQIGLDPAVQRGAGLEKTECKSFINPARTQNEFVCMFDIYSIYSNFDEFCQLTPI